MTNEIMTKIAEHFKNPAARIVVAAPGARTNMILSPANFSEMKVDGSGVRFRKLYLFASQLRFARVA